MSASNQGSLITLLQKEVSVTSVTEIRYVGKFIGYDSGSFTITLGHARNMGTENREAAVYMPPQNLIYGSIILDARHIKSFQPVASVDKVTDPAIVSYVPEDTTSTSSSSGSSSGAMRNAGRGSPKKAGSSGQGPSTIIRMFDTQNGVQRVHAVDMKRLMGQSGGSGGGGGGSKGHQNAGRGRDHAQPNRGQSNKNQPQQGGGSRKSQQKQQKQQKNNNRSEQRGGNNRAGGKQHAGQQQGSPTKRVSFKDSNQEGGSGRRQFTHIPQITRDMMARAPALKGNSAGGQQAQSKTAGGAKAPVSPRRQRADSQPGEFPRPKTTVKFEHEFDFDQGLKEFHELVTTQKAKPQTTKTKNDDDDNDNDDQKDAGKADPARPDPKSGENAENVAPPKEFYNKEKCFYDNLSSTAGVEDQPRQTRKEAMLTNKETFGTAFVPRRRSYYYNRRSASASFKSGQPRAGGREAERAHSADRSSGMPQRNQRRILAVSH